VAAKTAFLLAGVNILVSEDWVVRCRGDHAKHLAGHRRALRTLALP
jgi:hypothetical protein